MPFNAEGKSIKEIQEAFQAGEINKTSILKVFNERLNRPGKSQGWKNRYIRAISALNDDEDLVVTAFNNPKREKIITAKTKQKDDSGHELLPILNKEEFKLGDTKENILLETYVKEGEKNQKIRVRVLEYFPTNWRVNFPKAYRKENPIGTQFRATVEVTSSSADPETLFLKAKSKTIQIISDSKKPKKPVINQTHTSNPPQPEVPEFGKSGTIRKPSNLLKGLPSVFSPEKKETFQVRGLEHANTNTERFICALSALVWEIRKSHKGKKTVNLNNGTKQPSLSGEHGFLYSFSYDGDEEFIEGARIDIKVGPKDIKGSIASIFGIQPKTLIISLDEDCGNHLEYCTITQDDATFFESLQNRLEIEIGKSDKKKGIPVGMNLNLADDLLNGKSKTFRNSLNPEIDYGELNSEQIDFVRKMVENTVSFLWGPPGTGKTQTLSAGLTYFYENSERSLITSNTNKAVDQVLLKLCKRLQKEGKDKDLEDGKIVRIGRISHEELEKDFSSYVTVDGIATRRGSEMQKEINKLEKEKIPLEAKLKKLGPKYESFKELEKAKTSLDSINVKMGNIKVSLSEKEIEQENVKKQTLKIEKEKINYNKKGFFGKAFGKNIETIEQELEISNKNLNRVEKAINNFENESNELNNKAKHFKIIIKDLKSTLENENLKELEKKIENLETSLNEINAQISKLNKEMEGLRKKIISEALIVGSTLTKTFLSPRDLGKFENVIIDEASMALLPAVYFVASQSQNRCIISGDFRQIPAIVPSDNKIILDLIGRDIFQHSGMEKIFEDSNEGKNAGVLTQQYRMEPKICSLISDIGYAGRLKTAKDRITENLNIPELFSNSIIIIDTSPIYPYCEKDPFNSKSNITHALIARNIMRKFAELENSGNIGFCAPFRAQVKLMKKISEHEKYKENVSIGTVHTFQGDEKSTIIFDTVESRGEDSFIFPAHGQQDASKSSTLTVAISRAEQKLIFIANLRHLDNKIPALGYLRHILYDAIKTGHVIDANEVINLQTLESELSAYKKKDFLELGIDVSNLKSGLADQDLFFPLLKKDIENASEFIVIYSGFYTPNRVEELSDDLKSKIRTGVKVKIIIPPPERNGSMDKEDSKVVIETLEAMGVIIEFRNNIHQKAVLIDEDIVWFGSLNPLSYKSTLETMIRFDHPGLSLVFAESMSTNKKIIKKDSSFITKPENPLCIKDNCNSKTIFMRRKTGQNRIYYKCSVCQSTQNV